ncbi:hypothetical protein FC83_GL000155 [Agrilactobacillus composti DSM 18527 = JCM 14202]|uniref:HTH cro/C1-type domain-containing protein n=1 Tax=Agrilactobacillus composti DSM 18527 = JCM 14202 TaxID=1423734 RepID=X0PQ87_9LACO|nr:helix-turn-helix transcriptional regulator [Agrilactobacillus composti]KRM32871.1 hypothetical protein FC83_GL000155 [Agrilactobacillus composti DSM 18527 = JCM 14202]GAF39226.1 putative transcriptional regulator [Agrilactobacillus composti DSM 18527 = JCM 14202]
MVKNIKFDDDLKARLEDPEFKADFDRESNKLEAAIVISQARESAGLTQRDLAAKAGVPQSTVARIERGDNTSFETLGKIATALGKRIKLSLV